MNTLMRVSLVSFVVSLAVWALVAVWDAIIVGFFEGRYLHYGARLLLTVQAIAVDLAIVSGLVMIALFVRRAWERLGR